jgi:hypothetical protein
LQGRPEAGLSRASLEKHERPRAIETGRESARAQGSDPASFSLANQPVNVVTGNKATCPDRHHFGAALTSPDLNSPDLEPVEQHAVAATPSAESPDPSSRLYSYLSFHGLLQSHWGFSVRLIPFSIPA